MTYVKTDSANYVAIADAIRSKNKTENRYRPDQMARAIEALSGGIDNNITSYDQMNAVVRSYIDSVTYDPSDYNVSDIDKYVDISKDLDDPLGHMITNDVVGKIYFLNEKTGKSWEDSVSGNYMAYNLIPNAVHRYLINKTSGSTVKTGRLKPTGFLRMIYLTGPHNFRDVGGWSCDGGTVNYGLLFRGGQLSHNTGAMATEEDVKRLRNLGILYEVDLRNDQETAGADGISGTSDDLSSSYLGKDIYYKRFSLNYYVNALRGTDAQTTATVLRLIMDNVSHNIPTYFHCAAGADRTATIAFMLEAILGMSQSDMDKDYELTSFYPLQGYVRRRSDSTWRNMVAYINTLEGDTFRDKAITWFWNQGFTDDEINAYRHAVIDGDPEDIIKPVTHATITYSLANVTSSNKVTSVELGASYTTTLKEDTNFTMKSISVIMGGNDITSTAVSGKTVTISAVTGNVTIKASATAPRVNILPSATDADGNPYNDGKGWKSGYRLNSSGAESASSSNQVTGFIPMVVGQTMVLEGIKLPATNYTGYNTCYIVVYDANKACIRANYSKDWNTSGNKSTIDADNNYMTLTINEGASHSDVSTMAYVRFSALEITDASAVYIE